ncbi:MAG: carboxylating nicotinate-nucleotide diphosphorylase [Tissierellia bacterium]|nr:carboxylating nicotinate-nucleotide diphosphorylase [Tissierellia bacterium]
MIELNNIIIDPLILSAIREDITYDDVSTSAVVSDEKATVDIIAKEDGIIAGLAVFKRVFELLSDEVDFSFTKHDGDFVKDKELIGTVRGLAKVLLSGERVALNYLQRMSGIATYTNRMVERLSGSEIKLLDTRKTTPNMRVFEKYAVKIGGGLNHRYNLSDGVLLKDNHIGAAGGVGAAIIKAREYAPFVRKIEVETENLEMVREAIGHGADIIMLDNMSIEMIKEAVEIIGGKAEIECSGNIDFSNFEKYKNLGIDYISSGSITYAAKPLDISMKNLQLFN